MAKVFEGVLDGKGRKFAIVVSRFNEAISVRLLDGALDCLRRHNTEDDAIEIAWVPGSFEIPLVAMRLAQTKRYNAVICLGAVVRGATPHFEYIAAEVTKGIASIQLELGVPISYGVITSDNLEQAIEMANILKAL